jgi:hypothetical protein
MRRTGPADEALNFNKTEIKRIKKLLFIEKKTTTKTINSRYIIKERLSQADDKYEKMIVSDFVQSVGARSSIPGGGCVSALVASLGSSLACMVSQLTYGNRKFEKHDKKIRELLPAFYDSYNELVHLIDQDANAFNSYIVTGGFFLVREFRSLAFSIFYRLEGCHSVTG